MRTRNVIKFMQTFSKFHPEVMAKLVDDSINKWNDNEFSLLHEIQSSGKVNPLLLKNMEDSTLKMLDTARNERKIRRLKRVYELIVKAQKV